MIARANQTHELLWAAIVPAFLAFIGVVVTAWITFLNHRQGKRIDEQVRPENGMRLGELVEQVAKITEVTNGRVHDVSKRVDNVEMKLDEQNQRAADRIEAVAPLVDWAQTRMTEEQVGDSRFDRIENKLDQHHQEFVGRVETWEPLAAYVRKQMKKQMEKK